MIEGIFSAEFISNQSKDGFGVAVFSGNAVHGGDSSHYYRGKYKLDDQEMISGTIEVIKYSRDSRNSVLGPLDKYKLKLNGQVVIEDREFRLAGSVEGQPDTSIIISLKKLDGLVDD